MRKWCVVVCVRGVYVCVCSACAYVSGVCFCFKWRVCIYICGVCIRSCCSVSAFGILSAVYIWNSVGDYDSCHFF